MDKNTPDTILSIINEIYLIYFIALFWKTFNIVYGISAGIIIFLIDLIILSNNKELESKILLGKTNECDFSSITRIQVIYKTILVLILYHVFNLTVF